MIHNETTLLGEAWRRIFRHRCCPPENVLLEPLHPELSAHLKVCPWCAEDRGQALTFPAPPGVEKPAEQKIKAGEIRPILAKYGGWGPKARYYNSPLVLVLEIFADNRVEVVQIYDDFGMAGPDDIPLNPQFEAFAETWNRYTLDSTMLGCSYGKVDDQCLKKCRGQYQEPDIEPGSLLWFFRNLEVECGYFFYLQSIPEIPDRGWGQLTPGECVVQLRKLGLHCEEGENLAATVARITIPDTILPIAAADDTRRQFGLVLTLERESVIAYQICPVLLNQIDLHDGCLLVSGIVEDLSLECHDFQFWWKRGNEFVPAYPDGSGYQNNTFWAKFNAGDETTSGIDGGEAPELILRFFHFR